MDSDKAFGQKPRFGVRPEDTYRSENSLFNSRSKELINSLTRLLQLENNRRVQQKQTGKDLRAGIVTVITGVMGAKISNLLMIEKSN